MSTPSQQAEAERLAYIRDAADRANAEHDRVTEVHVLREFHAIESGASLWPPKIDPASVTNIRAHIADLRDKQRRQHWLAELVRVGVSP